MTAISIAESWYRLELSRKQRIRFVLDASDIGMKSQNKALQLLHMLCGQLPRFSQHSVTFLGSKILYDANLLVTDGADWFSKNKLRLSAITPVFELSQNDVRFVVIAASPLFDLMDWKDTPELNRTVFLNLGQEPITGGLADEFSPDAHHTVEVTQSPLKSVLIQSDHAIPVYWDNSGYSLDEKLALQSRNAETFSVTFALAGPATRVNVECTHENGKRDSLEVRPVEPESSAEPWAHLSVRAEAKIVHQCIADRAFQCPRCSGTHQSVQLKCKLKGEFLPTTLFSSIAKDPDCTFVLFRAQDDDTVFFSRIRNPVLALDASRVAIFRDGLPKLVEYDKLKSQWCLSELPFEQFCFVERLGAYAICVR